MGGKTIENKAARVANIQLQTSAYGGAITVGYGTNRVPANLLWFGNFQSTAHTETTGGGGKGIGKVTQKNTTYTYSAAAILSLGEGPIIGIGSVWKDKDKTDLATLGLTLFTGTATQSVWSFLSGWNVSGNWAEDQAYGYAGQSASFTDQAISYSSTAYLAASAYDLGDQAEIPNHNFEVQWRFIYGSGIADANPADFVPDMLTSSQYGCGLTSGQIGSLTSWSTYCRAAGLFFSPAYTEQRAGSDCLQEICDSSNASPLWSEGKLKIIPRGDVALTGNGATYTPDLTPQFDLGPDDFLGATDGEPVRVRRSTPADAYNRVQIEFLNRANQYNEEIVTAEDQDAIEKYGLRPAPVEQCHWICDGTIAKFVAQLSLQRHLYVRNEYDFELGERFAALEPMDIVTLTDPLQDMSLLPVRIISREEGDEGEGFSFTTEDLPIGTASAARYAHDNGLRWQTIVAQTPQNCKAPIIFEMPADLSATGLSIGLATGGDPADPLYGGCRVWLSLDGLQYKEEGIIYGSSRYGTTTANLLAHAAGLDNTSTLAVALRSNGQLLSGAADDRDKGTTLILVGSEYLGYEYATLTGTRAYNLTSLGRGLYNTTTGLKASGSAWVRVDDAIAILRDLDPALIGQMIYIKLTAFNAYAAGEQTLADVSAYTYTITGDMHALRTPVDFDTGVGGAGKPDRLSTRNEESTNLIAAPNDPATWSYFGTGSPGVYHGDNSRPLWANAAQLHDDGDGVHWGSLFPVVPDERVWTRHTVLNDSSVPGSSGATVGINFFDATGTILSGGAGAINVPGTDIQRGVYGAAVTTLEGSILAPAGAAFGSMYTIKHGSGGTSYVGEAWCAKSESAADVTPPLVSGPSTATFAYDYTGTAKPGDLPRDLPFKARISNGADVTSSSAWAATLKSGTASFTVGAATGVLNVTAVSTDAVIEVAATYLGKVGKTSVSVLRSVDAPPVGGAGGGGTGGTSDSTAAISNTGSSSYGSANTSVLSATTGSGGQVTLSAPLSFRRTTNGISDAYGKWQWRAVGGSWADVGSEIMAGSSAEKDSTDYQNDPGSISVSMIKTSLTANTPYEFQLLLRGSSGATLNFSGTAAAVGS